MTRRLVDSRAAGTSPRRTTALAVVGVLPLIVIVACHVLASGHGPVGPAATPLEVIDKVHAAAALLEKQGDQALAVLRDERSEFMWKDTYVFVVDCAADEVLANPAFPARQGGDIKQHTDYAGKRYGLELCATAEHGGWLEYTWPRGTGGEPSRKVSYVVSVPGRPYQVGAGVYDEHTTLAELELMTRAALAISSLGDGPREMRDEHRDQRRALSRHRR